MTKLEPTRTNSDLTATERLRALLDERGVEWRGGLPTETMVEADGLDLLYVVLPDGRVRAFIRNYLTPEQAVEATLGGDLQTENAKLREQMERLVTLLRVDCDIDASWDGLRRFWSIGLTEDGCLMRDRACKAEAENAKLRELVRDAWGDGHPDRSCEGCDIRDECHDDVERMRKDGVLRFSRCLFELRIEERMRELGIEEDA